MSDVPVLARGIPPKWTSRLFARSRLRAPSLVDYDTSQDPPTGIAATAARRPGLRWIERRRRRRRRRRCCHYRAADLTE